MHTPPAPLVASASEPSATASASAVEESVAAEIADKPSAETRRSYEHVWRFYRAWLATESLAATDVRPKHVQRYIATLRAKGQKKGTIGRALSAIRTLYSRLVCDELINPVRLCGSMFGLDVRRHRLFETSFPVMQPECRHELQAPRFAQATNRANLRRTVEVGVWRIPLDVQRRAMGIDWMPLDRLSQAIPPAYSKWLADRWFGRCDHEAGICAA